MAWIVPIPPSPRHPYERYQVCYLDGRRQRSAGIFPTMRRALASKRAIERGDRQQLPNLPDPDPGKASTLFGEYVSAKWWPAWKDQHPTSEYATRKMIEKRILPVFGELPMGELDASTIGAWKAAMVAEGLKPWTVNTYLSLLGTILNAAVDDDYLPRSPLLRKSGAGRAASTRNQPVRRREVWLTRGQLDQLVAAIDERYRALVPSGRTRTMLGSVRPIGAAPLAAYMVPRCPGMTTVPSAARRITGSAKLTTPRSPSPAAARNTCPRKQVSHWRGPCPATQTSTAPAWSCTAPDRGRRW
jgi:hypothetical protein